MKSVRSTHSRALRRRESWLKSRLLQIEQTPGSIKPMALIEELEATKYALRLMSILKEYPLHTEAQVLTKFAEEYPIHQ